MSVLIKGMDMPFACVDCECCITEPDVMPWCCLTHEGMCLKECNEQRLADCPLVETPKHGRLIDADALRNIFAKLEFCSDMGDAMELLDNAPTVIEAEE